MSSRSMSFTVPIPASEVEAAASAMNGDDASLFNEFLESARDIVLHTFSERAETEWYVSNIVQAFQASGLDYLKNAFNRIRSADMGQWSAYPLAGAELVRAIDGLHLLLSNLQKFPEMAVWDGPNDKELALLANPPVSALDAIARNNDIYARTEGIGTYAAISFLQGHLAILEYASASALGAIYCVRED